MIDTKKSYLVRIVKLLLSILK